MVLRLTLSYLGAGYAGWQRQKNAVAVQQVVEEALADLLAAPARVVGASRTDAGVHARAQEAHLELRRDFSLAGVVHGANHRLPADVRVLAAHRVPDGFHARHKAESKEYRYRLLRAEVLSPFDAPFALRVEGELDLARLRRAAAHLVGRHDFTAFALAGGAHRDAVRTIHAAEWLEHGPELVFRVVGDGFLRGMVRGLVGTLLDIGAGRKSPESLRALLRGRPRGEAGPTAPAHALTLERVTYPERWRPLESYPGGTPVVT
jgi:tRNA pseudouridine38-40 synthase